MRSLVAALLLAPLAAAAQTSAPPAPPAAAGPAAPALAPDDAGGAPQWSLGAGASTVLYGTSMNLSANGGGVIMPLTRGTASLERRLSDASWLVLGVDAAYARQRSDTPPNAMVTTTSDDTTLLQLDAGLRHVLTSARAPVAVSILALAHAGYAEEDQTWTGAQVPSFGGSSWLLGASLELAVERELTRALALRIASPLVEARWATTSTHATNLPDQSGSTFVAQVTLAPRLELRLYF